MRKIKLDLELLAVESFTATPEPQPRQGTVQGAELFTNACLSANPSDCNPSYCEAQASCDWTYCDLSCEAGCGGGGGGGTFGLAADTCHPEKCPREVE